MKEFIKELTKWLEEQRDEELQDASKCGCFEEVSQADACEYCADAYKYTLDKVKELEKRYLKR